MTPSDMTGSLPSLHHISVVEGCGAASVNMLPWERMLVYTYFLNENEITNKKIILLCGIILLYFVKTKNSFNFYLLNKKDESLLIEMHKDR